jgi:hypothetical protein
MKPVLFIAVGMVLLILVISYLPEDKQAESRNEEAATTSSVAEATRNAHPDFSATDSSRSLVPESATEIEAEGIAKAKAENSSQVILRVTDPEGCPFPNLHLVRFLPDPQWNRERESRWGYSTNEIAGEIAVPRSFLQPMEAAANSPLNIGRLEIQLCGRAVATLELPSTGIEDGLLEFTVEPSAWLKISCRPREILVDGRLNYKVWSQLPEEQQQIKTVFVDELGEDVLVPVPAGATLQVSANWSTKNRFAHCTRIDLPNLKVGEVHSVEISLQLIQWLSVPLQKQDGSILTGERIQMCDVAQSGLRSSRNSFMPAPDKDGVIRIRYTSQWSNTPVYLQTWSGGPNGERLEGWAYFPPTEEGQENTILEPVILRPVEEELLCSGKLAYEKGTPSSAPQVMVLRAGRKVTAAYRLHIPAPFDCFEIYARRDEIQEWRDEGLTVTFSCAGPQRSYTTSFQLAEQDLQINLK